MWFLRIVALALVAFIMPAFANDAPIFLWQFSPQSMAAKQAAADIPKHANFAAELALNAEIVPALKRDTTISLAVPMYAQPLTLNISSVSLQAGQHIVKATDGIQRLIFTSDGENTFATVITERGIWSIRGKGKGAVMYQTHDPFHHHSQPHTKNDYLIPPAQPEKKPVSAKPTTRRQADVTSNEIAVVDTYIIYNHAVESLYGAAGALTRINHLIAVTNDIYESSNVNMRVNALRIDKVDYPQTASSEQALLHATGVSGHSGVLTQSRQMRDAIGADAMIFFRPYVDDGTCGIAWMNSGFNSAFWMVSHTSIDCGEEVTAHELGHNMGLAHSRRQGDTGATFPFALGHGVDNNFSTVMAYPWVFGGGTQRVFKFSSPDLSCNGLPCGVDRNDPVNGADAVYALNQKRFEIAGIAQRASGNGSLTVQSIGATNVAIQSSSGQGGIAPYSLSPVALGEVVSLTAPATANNVPFAMWLGCDVVVGFTCEVTIRGDVSLTVVYSDGAMDFGSVLGAPELDFISSGDALWQPDFTRALTGIASLRSGQVTDNQTSSITTTLAGAGTLGFSWQVSSERDYDFLSFYINGELIAEISGSTPWQTLTYELDDATHVVEWRYSKDFSISEGEDAGWLDSVSWLPAPEPLKVTVEKRGNGKGTVTAAAVSFTCDAQCNDGSFTVEEQQSVLLVAEAAMGSNFVGWGGACSGMANCALAVSESTNVTAEFVLQPVTIDVAASAGGSAVVNAEINYYGELIVITLSPEQGFRVNRTVTGTCPAGRWIGGNQYQTGEVTSPCTVSFSFEERKARRKLPLWLLIRE